MLADQHAQVLYGSLQSRTLLFSSKLSSFESTSQWWSSREYRITTFSLFFFFKSSFKPSSISKWLTSVFIRTQIIDIVLWRNKVTSISADTASRLMLAISSHRLIQEPLDDSQHFRSSSRKNNNKWFSCHSFLFGTRNNRFYLSGIHHQASGPQQMNQVNLLPKMKLWPLTENWLR